MKRTRKHGSAGIAARRDVTKETVRVRRLRGSQALIAAAAASALLPALLKAQTVSYTTANSTYTQDFNGLPNSPAGNQTLSGTGVFDLTASPILATGVSGWYGAKSPNTSLGGTGANAIFGIDAGGGASGAFYSYGASSGGTSTDRALGSLASGTTIPSIGAIFTNNTGTTLTQFQIGFTAEQWRRGSALANSLAFSYLLGGSTILDGGTTAFNGLDATATLTSGTNGAVDGNSGANQTLKTGTVSGISWAPGTTLVIRWDDVNDGGNDDGIGVDDFSFVARASTLLTWTPTGGSTAWNLSSTNWLNGASPAVFGTNDTVTFGDTGVGRVDVVGGGVSPGGTTIANTSGTYTFTGGAIGGGGSVIKSNGGTAIFKATNTYTGGTSVTGGTLVVDGGDDRLGSSSGGLAISGGATVRTDTSGLTSARAVSIGSGGATFNTNGFNSTFSGTLSGSNNFTKTGSSSDLAFSGGWTYNGQLAISAGSLTMAQPSGSFSFSGDPAGGTFVGDLNIINGIRVVLSSGKISGGGTIRAYGTGVTIATISPGSADYTIANNIVLNPNNTGGFQAGIGADGTNNNTTISGVVSGNSDVIFSSSNAGAGTGNVILATGMTYTGATYINNRFNADPAGGTTTMGVVALGVNNALPTGTGVIFGGPYSAFAGAIDMAGFNQKIASLSSVAGASVNGITNSAGGASTLTVEGSASTTYGGTIGTMNSITLTGGNNIALNLNSSNTGTLTLTGTGNDYAGTTTVTGGRLNVNGVKSGTGAGTVNGGILGGTGTFAGAVTVSAGGKIAPGTSVGALTLTGGLDLSSNGEYQWELGQYSMASGFDQLAVTGGSLTLGGTSKISINFTDAASNPDVSNGFWTYTRSWKVLDFTGAGPSNIGSVLNGTYANGTFTGFIGTGDSAGDLFVKFTPAVAAGRALTWDGNAGTSPNPSDNNGTWTAASNWFDGAGQQTWISSPPDAAFFGANAGDSGTATVTVSTPVTAGEITFVQNSKNYLITGSTVTLSGPSTIGVTVANSAEIASVLALTGSSRGVDVSTGQTLSLSGVVSGSTSAITKSGPGTLALTNASNSFGNLSIASGTVQVAADGALGSGATSFTGGILQATGSFNSASRGMVFSSTSTVDTNGQNVSFGGVVSGAGTLTKIGTGVLTLNNASNSVANITVTGPNSVLAVSSDGALGNSSGTISFGNGGGAIRLGNGFNSSGTRAYVLLPTVGGIIDVPTGTATLSGTLTGSTLLTKSGGGELVLAGATTGSRAANNEITGGTVVIAAVSDLSTSLTNVSMLGTGRVFVDSGATFEIRNVNSGAAGQSGANIVSLRDGGTLKGTGTASLTKSGSPDIQCDGTPSMTIATGASSSDLFTIGSSIRNSTGSVATSPAVLHITGSGTVYLASGPSSTSLTTDHYTGSWQVDSGTLQVGPVIGLGTPLNALGYTYGSDGVGTGPEGGARPVRINATGTLSGGVDHTTGPFKSPITLNGGALGTTQGDAGYSGDITINPSLTSIVKTTDTGDGSTARTVHLETSAFMNGDISWGASSTLSVTGNGTLNFNRSGGAVTVGAGAVLLVNAGTTVNLDGSQDSLSDGGSNHVDVMNNSTTSLHVVSSGTHRVGNIDGVGNTTVDSGATLIAHHVRQNALTVNGNVQIRAQSSLTSSGSVAGTNKVSTLSIGGSGQLNLTNTKLIDRTDAIGTYVGSSGSYSGLSLLIKTGRNGGTWNGTGGIITSESKALAPNLPRTTIGIAKGTQVKSASATATVIWAGQTITGTDTLLMYTYAGDANLDGKLDADDYGKIDTNIALGNGSRARAWANGDFNYDGLIDIGDYGLLDTNIALAAGARPTIFTGAGVGGGGGGGGIGGVSAVPEPTGLSVVALGAVALLKRRRRAR